MTTPISPQFQIAQKCNAGLSGHVIKAREASNEQRRAEIDYDKPA
jgi:hypothetical protein